MSLQKFCRKALVKVSPDTNITKACRLMEKNNVGCLVAERDNQLCGIITDRDIALRVAGARKNPKKTLVKDIMTRDPIRISADKDLFRLMALMHAHHVRRMPIVNGFDRTLGIVTFDDLIAQVSNEMSEMGKTISSCHRKTHGRRRTESASL